MPDVRQGQSVRPHQYATFSERYREEMDRLPTTVCPQPVPQEKREEMVL